MSPHPPRQLHLNAFLMTAGHHDAAWRHPASAAHRATDAAHSRRTRVELARTAERGAFDSVFFADGLVVWNRLGSNVSGMLEPITLLAAITGATRHIGLIATVSTTFNEPFTVARKFASLDRISGGRAGWNIVTSSTEAEARNFGSNSTPTTHCATSSPTSSCAWPPRCGTAGRTTRSCSTARSAGTRTSPRCTPERTSGGDLVGAQRFGVRGHPMQARHGQHVTHPSGLGIGAQPRVGATLATTRSDDITTPTPATPTTTSAEPTRVAPTVM